MEKEEIKQLFDVFNWKEKKYQHKDILRFSHGWNEAAVYFPSGTIIFTDHLNRPTTIREATRNGLVSYLKNINYGN